MWLLNLYFYFLISFFKKILDFTFLDLTKIKKNK